MNEFDAVLDDADALVMDTMANVSVYIEDAPESVRGIFDQPSAISKLPNGGQIKTADYAVSVLTADATAIQRKTKLIIEHSDGSRQTFTVINPDECDFSMSKFTLKPADADSHTRPDFRY